MRIGWVGVRRTYRGFYLSGRRRYVKVKWLHPGVRAVRWGLWQVQVGRLLVRVAVRLLLCPCCREYVVGGHRGSR